VVETDGGGCVTLVVSHADGRQGTLEYVIK